MPLYQQVACAIICAKKVCINTPWNSWATKWLSGEDRSTASAFIATEVHACSNFKKSPKTMLIFRAAEGAANAADNLGESLRLGMIRAYEDPEAQAKMSACESIYTSEEIRPNLLMETLTTHFICPHCHKQPDQHTKEGKCLFSPYMWKGINDAWRP